jgi:hypothetical protein
MQYDRKSTENVPICEPILLAYIGKNGSIKVNVFRLNFVPNILTFVDHFLFIFWYRENLIFYFLSRVTNS